MCTLREVPLPVPSPLYHIGRATYVNIQIQISPLLTTAGGS